MRAPAHPGYPGSKGRKTVVVVVYSNFVLCINCNFLQLFVFICEHYSNNYLYCVKLSI